MKIIEGLVINLIVMVRCFFCFVDNLEILGNLINVFFIGFNFMRFIIWFINFCISFK